MGRDKRKASSPTKRRHLSKLQKLGLQASSQHEERRLKPQERTEEERELPERFVTADGAEESELTSLESLAQGSSQVSDRYSSNSNSEHESIKQSHDCQMQQEATEERMLASEVGKTPISLRKRTGNSPAQLAVTPSKPCPTPKTLTPKGSTPTSTKTQLQTNPCPSDELTNTREHSLGIAEMQNAYRETLKPLSGIRPLSVADPGLPGETDWEAWFIAFEQVLKVDAPYLPKERWVEQLRHQCTPDALTALNKALDSIKRKANILAERSYELVRDHMLKQAGERYHVSTYLARIVNVERGKRSAEDLCNYLKTLSQHYERARQRALQLEKTWFPELPASMLAFYFTSRLATPAIHAALHKRQQLNWDDPGCFDAIADAACEYDSMHCGCLPAIQASSAIAAPAINSIEVGKVAHDSKPDKPNWTPPATPRKQQKEVSKSFCKFCGTKGHFMRECTKWAAFSAKNPWAKSRCPKCFMARHTFFNCKQSKGRFWGITDEESAQVVPDPRPSQTEARNKPLALTGVLLHPESEAQLVRTGEVDSTASEQQTQKTITIPESQTTRWTQADESIYNFRLDVRRRAKMDPRLVWSSADESMMLSETQRRLRATMQRQAEDEPSVHAESETKPCASMTIPSPMGSNIFAKITILGQEALALIDSGSARTLLDGKHFLPGILQGFRSVHTLPPDTALLDASGNRTPKLGEWPAWAACNEYGGRIIVDVLDGCPTKVILGLDAFRALTLAVVCTGDEFELRTGGWRMRPARNITISTLTDHHRPMGAVGLYADLSDRVTDVVTTEQPACTTEESRDDFHDCTLYPMDGEDQWEEDAVHYLGFGRKDQVARYLSESATKRRKRHTANRMCGVALNPSALFVLNDFPRTKDFVSKICSSTQTRLSAEQTKALLDLCLEFSDIWNAGDRPLATTNLTTFTVELLDGATPVAMAPRAASAEKRQRIQNAVEKGLQAGIYEPSDSEWSAPVVLVSRPNSTEDRLCVDYRKVNELTRVPRYPLPRIQQALDALVGKAYFSLFDFPSAYYQIEVEPKSRPYLAFITPDGHYQPTRMPFGAAGAPATQQRMVDRLLAGMKWICALAYLDDVMIFSNTFEEHLTHLRKFFERVRKASLHLKPQKCKLCHPETSYLGFLVSATGVKPDPAKTAAIRDFKQPKDARGLRSFLGIGSYYRRFIKDFARISKPLQDLLRALTNGEKRPWGPSENDAFNAIKNAIIKVAEMAHPQPGKEFLVDCDACRIGLGASLAQKDDVGLERPIAFASRLLRPNESRWSTTELEAFAVVWALDTFREYVEGSPTLVRTDHSPLPYLRNQYGKSAKIARWVMALQDFAFDLKHRSGRCHNVPDALSRFPTGPPGEDDHDFMSDGRAPGTPGAFVAVALTPLALALAGVAGDQHAFSAGGGREVILQTHVPDEMPGERRRTREISLNNIREGQLTCPETILLHQVLDGVPGAKLPRWAEKEGLMPTLRDGVICMEKENGNVRLVHLPIVFRTGVIQRMHYGPYSGHFGKKKTIRKIRARFIWGTLSRDVKKVLRTCIHCWSQTRGNHASRIPAAKLPIGWPGDILAMDIFGPLRKARSGARYVLVCIDHFSRWVEMAAFPCIREQEVAQFLRDVWIPHHGVPRVVLSDNGPQFIAEMLRMLCESIGARKIYSSPYYPQGNSICESFMRTVKKALGALALEDRSDWDIHLQAVAFAHNSTPHSSTGYSPYFLEHGREATLPIQRHLDTPMLDPPSQGWLKWLWLSRLHVYSAHMAEMKRRQELLSRPGAILPKGTIVAVRLTPADLHGLASRKLAPRYLGPWVVLENYENGVTYRVRDPISGAVRQVPRARLKVLELKDIPVEAPGNELPRWVAPWRHEQRRTTMLADSTLQNTDILLQASPAGAQLTETGPTDETQQEVVSPPPATAIEPTPGAEPRREGLRMTVSRRARAAPGGVFVKARRGRRALAGGG